MVLFVLLWDIFFVIFVKIVDAAVVFNHLDEHVSYAQTQDVILEVWVGDFRYGVVKDVTSHLMIEVVVCVLVKLLEIGNLRNLEDGGKFSKFTQTALNFKQTLNRIRNSYLTPSLKARHPASQIFFPCILRPNRSCTSGEIFHFRHSVLHSSSHEAFLSCTISSKEQLL